jgi:hypothetical protein
VPDVAQVASADSGKGPAPVGRISLDLDDALALEPRDRFGHDALREPCPARDVGDRTAGMSEYVPQHQGMAGRQRRRMPAAHRLFADLRELPAQHDQLQGFHIPDDTSSGMYRQECKSARPQEGGGGDCGPGRCQAGKLFRPAPSHSFQPGLTRPAW